MSDVHGPEARSRNMAAIRAKNTRPEMQVRRAIHAAGFRYRLHGTGLPGRPDIILPRHHTVIFINGCFFHGHDCSYFRWPATRTEFWRTKITGNQVRDARNVGKLLNDGWRVLTVWECALRGAASARSAALAETVTWLRGSDLQGEIRSARHEHH